MTLKCTFALLTDDKTHNSIRKIAVEVNSIIDNGFNGALLPAHISLKQPFDINRIDSTEKFFDFFASAVPAMKIKMKSLYCWQSVIGIEVEETSLLRKLHNKLNAELHKISPHPAALFDGDNYTFHLTIAFQGQNPENYRRAFQKVKNMSIPYECEINKIGMFIYNESSYLPGKFASYKINTLSKPIKLLQA